MAINIPQTVQCRQAISVLVMSVACSSLHAQPIEWVGTDGLWSDPSHWTGSNVPSLHTDFPVLGGDVPYRVEIDNSFVFGTLSILNPAVRLELNAGLTAWIFSDIQNEGLIVINPQALAATTILSLPLDAALSGAGTLRLNAQATPGNSRLVGDAQITNSIGHTIAGTGIIEGAIVNAGTIVADDPTGSQLWLKGTLAQSQTGILHAATSDIRIHTSTIITGGTLKSDPGVRIYAVGDVEMSDTHISAQFDILSNTAQTLTIAGVVVNDGLIRMSTSPVAVPSVILLEDGATLSGTGSVLFHTRSLSDNESKLRVEYGGVATNAHGHTIAGAGWLTIPESSTFINQGTIRADIPDHQIFLQGNFTGGGNYIAEEDCRFEIFNYPTHIDGGFFQSEGNGVFRVQSGVEMSNFTNTGLILLVGRSNSARLEGQIMNAGTIGVDTHLDTQIPTTYSGTGVVSLRDYSSSVGSSHGGSIVNAIGHTFRGDGLISGPFFNFGMVTARMGSSSLEITGQHGPGTGTYDAGDSTITLNQCTIDGAILATGPAGTIRFVQAQLIDITNNALLVNGSLVESVISGVFTNNHTVLISGGASQSLRFANTMTIEGTGTIDLRATALLNPPQLIANFQSVVTINPDQTIIGHGWLRGIFINQGTIDPFKTSPLNFTPSIAVDNLTLASTSRLNIDILDSLTAVEHMGIVDNGTLTLGGTLNIQYRDGIEPDFGQWVIVDGAANAQIIGEFDQINLPPTPPNRSFRFRRTASQLTLVLTCPSDLNADFEFNFFDVSIFLSAFNAQAPDGDFNNDGIYNFFDISAFLAAFNAPCQ